MAQKSKITKAGRGRDGDFAEVHIESGEELLPQEAVRQIKLGNVAADYSHEAYREEKTEPPHEKND
ncbi:MAG: hypothetical protein ACOWWO_13785 [Peptococcaceae bacterium]